MASPPTTERLDQLYTRTCQLLADSTEGALSRRQLSHALSATPEEMNALRERVLAGRLLMVGVESWPTAGRPLEAWVIAGHRWAPKPRPGLESPERLGDRQARRRRIAAQFPRPTDRTREQAERVWSA